MKTVARGSFIWRRDGAVGRGGRKHVMVNQENKLPQEGKTVNLNETVNSPRNGDIGARTDRVV